MPSRRSVAGVFFVLLVLTLAALAGCGQDSAPSPSPSPPTAASSPWVRVASDTYAPAYLGNMLGPLRLRTGHVRIVVTLGGHPGPKALNIIAFRRSAGPALTGGHTWDFGGRGTSQATTDLRTGRWAFTVSKLPDVPATVTIYERR
jgi:hypothetical protein